MRPSVTIAAVGLVLVVGLGPGRSASGQQRVETSDVVRVLVSRLQLAPYKATIKGLTRFGDRRQGTTRNRDAVDWIEAQLQAVGCTSTERITYIHDPQPGGGGRRGRGRTRPELNPAEPTPTGGRIGRNGNGPGGSSIFGYRRATGVERDPMAQADEALRALNSEELHRPRVFLDT